MPIVADQQVLSVIVGVDTHLDTHVAAAIDGVGGLLGVASFNATERGYAALERWATSFGPVAKVGVEGTGAYGAGLIRFLRTAEHAVVEVDRPDRKTRRANGKSDPVDAEAAARAVLAGTASGTPKTRDGDVEMIRMLRVARRSAIKGRTQAANQLHSLITTAPAVVRTQLGDVAGIERIARCTNLRPGELWDPTAACKLSLRLLARRHFQLSAEIAVLDGHLDALVAAAAPALVAAFGVGTDVAGQLLVTAGDNPDRLHSEAAFAHLCGVAPLPASSGRTHRHRLNRGGDRAANHALWRIAMVRKAHHEPRTEAYFQRRRKEGLSDREIMRCVKRAIAREVYRLIIRS